ncbi:hypothetical protein Hanom_Chr08g00752811 [Helianthus anomalus]
MNNSKSEAEQATAQAKAEAQMLSIFCCQEKTNQLMGQASNAAQSAQEPMQQVRFLNRFMIFILSRNVQC